MDKIDTQYTLESNPPNEEYLEMLMRTVANDEAIKNIVVMPNWSYDWLMPPQGFVAEFDANAPFKPDLFYQDLFCSMSLTRVESIDERMMEECSERVLKAIPSRCDNPAQFQGSDEKKWHPSFGDRNATIGLYSANRMNSKTQMIEQTYFIISYVKMDPETYKQMENYFTECEKKGKTYKEVFFDNPIIEQFQALVVRNRRRTIHDFAEQIGASVRSRKYSKGVEPMSIANEEFFTQTNYVKLVDDTKMIFYSNCTSSADVQHGLLFQRAHLQAPLVYVGPSARKGDELFSGNKWTNDLHNAFPISFGKHVQPATWKQFSRIGISEQGLSEKLITEGELKDSETLLRYFPYRERTAEFRKIEEKLGYNYKNVIPVNAHLIRFV